MLQDADREGDGGGEGELSVNQMELLELEMRARAIKAMLLAQEQRESQSNSWHCTKSSNSYQVLHNFHFDDFIWILLQINCLVNFCWLLSLIEYFQFLLLKNTHKKLHFRECSVVWIRNLNFFYKTINIYAIFPNFFFLLDISYPLM